MKLLHVLLVDNLACWGRLLCTEQCCSALWLNEGCTWWAAVQNTTDAPPAGLLIVHRTLSQQIDEPAGHLDTSTWGPGPARLLSALATLDVRMCGSGATFLPLAAVPLHNFSLLLSKPTSFTLAMPSWSSMRPLQWSRPGRGYLVICYLKQRH